jgi:hypothetical protein
MTKIFFQLFKRSGSWRFATGSLLESKSGVEEIILA